MSKKYGKWVKIRVTKNPSLDEWTNVGVMVFDEYGKRIYGKMNFDRAIQRGDASYWILERDKEYERYNTLEDVDRALNSMGHAMSSIQVTEPLPSAIRDNYDDLFRLMVLGESMSK